MKKSKNNLKRYIINILLISIIVSIVIWIIIENYQENQLETDKYNAQAISTVQENNIQISQKNEKENTVKTVKQYPKEEILQTYKGYNVCAKLEIPSIQLETYVLSKYSKDALEISVTKFWGVNPNQEGNFCVAGHNYINSNMFNNLKKVKIGDRLFISDNEVGKVEYEVFEIDTVVPEDVSCLDAKFENEKEVTLITCTNDSQKRIIVKAKEV